MARRGELVEVDGVRLSRFAAHRVAYVRKERGSGAHVSLPYGVRHAEKVYDAVRDVFVTRAEAALLPATELHHGRFSHALDVARWNNRAPTDKAVEDVIMEATLAPCYCQRCGDGVRRVALTASERLPSRYGRIPVLGEVGRTRTLDEYLLRWQVYRANNLDESPSQDDDARIDAILNAALTLTGT